MVNDILSNQVCDDGSGVMAHMIGRRHNTRYSDASVKGTTP